jgi:hypothetical protein
MLSNLEVIFNLKFYQQPFMFGWFWIVQIIDNNLSQPSFFKVSSSHPLEIFLVILQVSFWYIRMICAVPLYIIKVMGKKFFPENNHAIN